MAKPDPERIRKWGQLAGIGPLLVASVLVGYFGGGWLDAKLGTAPWLMVVGVFAGAAAGFVELFRMLRDLGEVGRGGRRPGGRGGN